MVPLVAEVMNDKLSQFVFHGPESDDAHSTVAEVPGYRPEQVSTPFWLNELMTGAWALTWLTPTKSASAMKKNRNSVFMIKNRPSEI